MNDEAGRGGLLHAGFPTLGNIEMIVLRLSAENKKVLAVQSCSQAKRKQREEKMDEKEEGN